MDNLSNLESVVLGEGPSDKFPKSIFSLIILLIVFLLYGEFCVAFFLAFGSVKPSPIEVKRQLIKYVHDMERPCYTVLPTPIIIRLKIQSYDTVTQSQTIHTEECG